jgi:CubicO group peptidase (beta-lactamase class C family)
LNAIEELLTRARREVDEGLLPSCQLALAKDGRILASETYGDATDDTRYVIFSATKAVVASAMWVLIGEGTVRVEDRAAEIVPEFGTNGKDVITIEQVMLHTAGFPYAPLGPPQWGDRSKRLEAFSTWRLNWEPGTAYEYHATSAHWVLVEIIERVTGTDYRNYIRTTVLEPLGLKKLQLGGASPDVAETRYVGEEMTPDELEAAFGVRELPAPPGSLASIPDALMVFCDPANREVGVPGGGAVSTAMDLALFYQALLHPSAPWDPAVVADATGRVRNNLPDRLLGVPASRGLGVVIAGDDGRAHLRGFGKTQSPRAFGHNGAGGQIAFADPQTGISFVYLTNGLDRHMIREARRTVGLASRAGAIAT